MTQAKHGIDDATLQLARSIPDPRRRAEALTAAASYYAEHGARDTSRSVFREAFAVAKEVGNSPDNESWNSSSDATRRVARVQAQHDLEGLIQVASFHPDFRFEGEPEGDMSHFTNRSPYPTLHLLREDSVERAVASEGGDADKIVERNITTLRELGLQGWQALLAKP